MRVNDAPSPWGVSRADDGLDPPPDLEEPAGPAERVESAKAKGCRFRGCEDEFGRAAFVVAASGEAALDEGKLSDAPLDGRKLDETAFDDAAVGEDERSEGGHRMDEHCEGDCCGRGRRWPPDPPD